MSDMSGRFFTAQEHTRDPRQRRLVIASMSFDIIKNQEMVIRNASKRGLGGATQGVVPGEGERICVTLPNGNAIFGVVRWKDGPCFGLALEQELYADTIAEVKMKFRNPNVRAESAWEVSRLHRVITPRPDISHFRRVY